MWVKICGLTDPQVAAEVSKLRPDAVGLNFAPGSKRLLTLPQAERVRRQIADGIDVVGVFVNQTADEILSTCRSLEIRIAQLHGDEPPSLAAELEELEIIRAVRVPEIGDDWRSVIESHQQAGIPLRACLVDAFVPGQYGGAGQTAPWELLAQRWRRSEWPPLVLAGGLNPENVQLAIAQVRPRGVDVASGVESSPGVQNPERVAAFLAAARAPEMIAL